MFKYLSVRLIVLTIKHIYYKNNLGIVILDNTILNSQNHSSALNNELK